MGVLGAEQANESLMVRLASGRHIAERGRHCSLPGQHSAIWWLLTTVRQEMTIANVSAELGDVVSEYTATYESTTSMFVFQKRTMGHVIMFRALQERQFLPVIIFGRFRVFLVNSFVTSCM